MPTTRPAEGSRPQLPEFTFPPPPPSDDEPVQLIEDDVGVYSDVRMTTNVTPDNALALEQTSSLNTSTIRWDSDDSMHGDSQSVESLGTPLRRTQSADNALTQQASLLEALDALDLHSPLPMRLSRSQSQSGPTAKPAQFTGKLEEADNPAEPTIQATSREGHSRETKERSDAFEKTESPDSHIPGPPPNSPTVLQHANALAPVPRFHHLLKHTARLCHQNTYTTDLSNILARVTVPSLPSSSRHQTQPSPTRFATNLSAAQDASHTSQPLGPVYQDLKLFASLWHTTTSLLDNILSAHAVLSLEAFGWGVYGLSSGLIETDPLVLNHKMRLHTALSCLPYLTGRKKVESSGGDGVMVGYMKDAMVVRLSEGGRVHSLTSARRSVHVCSWLLVQGMRKEGWMGVRWGHGIRVCEGWMKLLGWDDTSENEGTGQGGDADDIVEQRDALKTSQDDASGHRRTVSLN